MPGICPSCNRQSTVESEFCPACGAPMNPDAQRIKEERINNTQILLPMKWHKFLTRFSLPLGTVSSLYSLYITITTLIDFQPELYRPDALLYVEWLLRLDVALTAVLIPAFILAEIYLLRMRWRGVQAVLFIYLSQAVFSLIEMILALFTVSGNITWELGYPLLIFELTTPMAMMILMFFLVRLYYNKRRQLFSK